MRQTKFGVSLVEVISALAIIVILTAVALPFYARYSNRSLAMQIGSNLRMLATAINEYRTDMGAYPPSVNELIVAPTTSSTDLCTVNLTAVQIAGWNGPYLTNDISSTKLVMETDTLSNTFSRTPSSATSRAASGTIDIAVFNTSAQRAAMVDELLDGNTFATSGPIIWGTVGPRLQLTYRIAIAGC